MKKFEYEVPDLTNLIRNTIEEINTYIGEISKQIYKMEREIKHLKNQQSLLINIIDLKSTCKGLNEEIEELERV